ncbi:hypothetical protein SAMN05421780_10356 [Flexibacter flexilis DSM 6793]|uniref:Outer membrane protein beta-barrel domain-containing protein n=1 Tax=Flexibacter flexilis DSM 6793 TaxID=927664 RepID=A0A1I1GVN1_9BACT|nr:DUF6268 family outer membrane beta-barrel protein [Flexibacter flexilis]SFC13908.1 hypothetical protein SAMN05421780_10356 [Flexibacter flexilis DSM 6793]
MKKIIISLSLVGLYVDISAQERDFASIQHSFSALKYNDTTANTRQTDIKIRFPVWHKNKNAVIVGASYKYLKLNKMPSVFGENLHGISLPLFGQMALSARTTLVVFGQAGFFLPTNRAICSDDFRYGAGFRLRFQHSAHFATGWGLGYGHQFFGHQIVPFIEIDYRPMGSRWSITGQFPIKPKVLYRINTRWRVGLELSGEAASFRLANKNYSLQQNQWIASAKWEYKLSARLLLSGGVGKNMRQTYKLYQNPNPDAWTIITFPVGQKSESIRRIDGKQLFAHISLSFGMPNSSQSTK